MLIALILAHSVNPFSDRFLLMAKIHDLGVFRTGDVDFLSRLYCEQDDDLAISETVADTSIRNAVLSAWEEYKTRTSLEARIVKDADILDCDLELREQSAKGATLEEALSEIRRRAREKLSTNTARHLYDAIKKSDPHEWWTSTILESTERKNNAFRKIG